MVNQQSSLNWEPGFHNFGNIEWHKEHKASFKYVGNKTISSIESSCPCVQIELSYDPVVTITAKWKPKKPDSAFTSSTKAITIKYLDRTREHIYLTAVIT